MCTKNQTNLCGLIECNICYNRSLYKWLNDNGHLDKFIKYINNEIKQPISIRRTDNNRALFNCKQCSHIYSSSINKYCGNHSSGCLHCGPQTVLCGNIDCKLCFVKSLASYHNIDELWISNMNLGITPYNVTLHSGKKYWMKCKNIKCRHPYYTSIDKFQKNEGCRFCSKGGGSNVQLCDNPECAICFNNSFASHYRAKEWDINANGKTPREVRLSSGYVYHFICNLCKRRFSSKLGNIVYNNQWCDCERYKSQNKVAKAIDRILVYNKQNNIIYTYNVITDKIWEIYGHQYRPDFRIDELKLIIEYDGRQHFEQVANWESPHYTKLLDTYKVLMAVDNQYSVIRISYRFIKRKGWIDLLYLHLKFYNEPNIIYLDVDENLYAQHMELIDKYYNNINLLINEINSHLHNN